MAAILPVTIYPRILVTAKNKMKYKKYLFVNTFETELGIFIFIIYTYFTKKLMILFVLSVINNRT
jgi:hypothetical protein